MEKSKLVTGVHYAYRGSARQSRYGSDRRNRVRLVKILTEVKPQYQGYRWERDLAEKHQALSCHGVVVGKTLLLVENLTNEGEVIPRADGKPNYTICSSGCLTATWNTYCEKTAGARAAAEKREAERKQREAEQEREEQHASEVLASLHGYLDRLGITVLKHGVAAVISVDDLSALVLNAVEMNGWAT